MKQTILITLLIIVFALPLYAAFLTDIPMEITQPDGTTFNCWASGDEFHNWLHDADNYTIIQDKETGWYSYAQKTGSGLEPSAFIIGQSNPRSSGLQPGLNIDEEVYKQRRRDWWQDAPRSNRTPTSGQINNIVVYIRFSDQTEFTSTLSFYDSMFNSSIPNTNSMYNYFMEDSYGNLSVTTSFYPYTTENLVISYQDSNPRGYFTPYSATNTIGYSGDTERRLREHTLLQNAIAYIAPMVPADLVIDADNDGKVDNVCFVVKGSSGAWADLLWPHMWVLYSFEVMLHGSRVYTYNFNLENSMATSGVGVLCHEMSHSLGLPDLYHYTSNGISPVGRWDLMESNRNPPQHHTAYMKYRYTDWLPPVRTITQSGTYWVNKMLNQNDNCYKILSNNPQYYYFVEFRKTEGFFEPSLPGSGLLVYRIDTSQDGEGNTYGPPDELYVYRPGGTTTSNGTVNSAHYSQESGRTAINESTSPSPFLGDGQQGGLNITQIGSSAGDSISFYITLPEPPPLDYDEGFESGDFNVYAWAFSGSANWQIDQTGPYEGSFSAKSGAIGHNQNSTMSMIIQVPVAGNISFFKKVSSEAGYDYLKFYINGTQMGQWAGISNWSYVQYPIMPGTHELKWSYVKDQGVVAGSDCAWVDNIAFRWEAWDIHFPPTDFAAFSMPDDIGIQLTWDMPIPTASTLMGHRVFKNGVQIIDLGADELSFQDFSVIPNQSYTYYVKSFYSNPHGHSFATDTLSVLVEGIPVIPVIVSAEIVDTNSVHLQWMLPETDRGIIGFYVYRNGALIQTIDADSVFVWTDENLNWGQYSYQVASRYATVASDPSEPVLVVIDEPVNTDEQISGPLVFGISRLYPNPFRQNAYIQYCVDKDNLPIDISIYNLKGQKVRTIKQEVSKAGFYETAWNGKDESGKAVTSGVYFCRMQSSSRTETQKLLLIK